MPATKSSRPKKKTGRAGVRKKPAPRRANARRQRSGSGQLRGPAEDTQEARRRDEPVASPVQARAPEPGAAPASPVVLRQTRVESADISLGHPHGPEGESHRGRPGLEPREARDRSTHEGKRKA